MRIRTRLIGAAALLSLAIAGSGCSEWTPTPGGPPTFTLSGIVTETTSAGKVPIEGVTIETFACSPTGSNVTYTAVSTNGDGRYTVPGMCSGSTGVWVSKDGYRDKNYETTRAGCDDYDCYPVTISGNTRVDFELVRLSELSASSLDPLAPSP